MNKGVKILVGVIVLAVILAAVLSGDKDAAKKGQEQEVVKVGAIAPFTGDAAVYGEDYKNSVTLAFEAIVAAGDKINIEFINEDGGCNPKDSINAGNKLINIDKVNIIYGGLCSGETLAVTNLAQTNDVLLLSSISSSPEITNAGDNVFRLYPSDSASAETMAEYFEQKGYTKVTVLAENTDYAQALQNAFVEKFEGESISEDFSSEEYDFKTALTKLNSSDSEAFFFIPQQLPAIEIFFNQANEVGLKPDVYVSDIADTSGIVEIAGDVGEGMVFISVKAEEDQEFLDLQNKFKERYGEPKGAPFSYISRMYYGVILLNELVGEHGEDVAALKKALYAIEGREFPGGVLTIDKNGDAVGEFVLKIIENKEVKILAR